MYHIIILQDNVVAASALSFLNLLPRIKCVSPLELREADGVLPDVGELIIKKMCIANIMKYIIPLVGCDHVTFKHKQYKLVYNYLRRTRGRQITAEINGLQDQLQVYMQ